MKNSAFVLFLGFVLSGCHSLSGTMTVVSPLEVAHKDGRETVAAGTYNADLKVSHNGSKMKLTVKGVNGKDQKLTLKAPSGVKFPSRSGAFDVRGSEIGQAWDVRGVVNTQATTSDLMSGIEGCTAVRSVYTCYPYGGYGGYGRRGPYGRCGYYPVSYPGTRHVEYRNVTTTSGFKMEFLGASNQALATFDGSRTHTERAYERIGECY